MIANGVCVLMVLGDLCNIYFNNAYDIQRSTTKDQEWGKLMAFYNDLKKADAHLLLLAAKSWRCNNMTLNMIWFN